MPRPSYTPIERSFKAKKRAQRPLNQPVGVWGNGKSYGPPPQPIIRCSACRVGLIERDVAAHKGRCPGRPFTRATLLFAIRRR